MTDGPAGGTPRWVYAIGLVVVLLVGLLALLVATGHGPGVHAP